MTREKVKINGRWAKAVSFAKGPGLRVQSVSWTAAEYEAQTFLPVVAQQIRRMYNPAVVAQMNARQDAAVAAVERVLADAIESASKEMGKDVRVLLAPLRIKW
jgi:hypothetical protein